jgi:hypothetical protein
MPIRNNTIVFFTFNEHLYKGCVMLIRRNEQSNEDEAFVHVTGVYQPQEKRFKAHSTAHDAGPIAVSRLSITCPLELV